MGPRGLLLSPLTFCRKPFDIHSSGIQEAETGVHILDLVRRQVAVRHKGQMEWGKKTEKRMTLLPEGLGVESDRHYSPESTSLCGFGPRPLLDLQHPAP